MKLFNKYIIILTGSLLLVFLSSCGFKNTDQVVNGGTVGEPSKNKQIVRVELNATADHSASWEAIISDETTLAIESQSFTPDQNNENAVQAYTVEGLKEGVSTITFAYNIPNGNTVTPLYSATYQFIVDANLNIKILNYEGTYYAMQAFLSLSKEKADLEEDPSFYYSVIDGKLLFAQNESCYNLQVYENESQQVAVASFAISLNGKRIYKFMNGEYVLLN